MLAAPNVKLSVPKNPIAPPLDPLTPATIKPFAFDTKMVPLMVAEPPLLIVIKFVEAALVENLDPASTTNAF